MAAAIASFFADFVIKVATTGNSFAASRSRDDMTKRKRMGIEPTKHRFGHLTGFEDRGGHQTSKRFLSPRS